MEDMCISNVKNVTFSISFFVNKLIVSFHFGISDEDNTMADRMVLNKGAMYV